MSARQPIVIRGTGATRNAVTWICALSLVGFLLMAIINASRSIGMSLLVAGLAAFFGSMLLYIMTLRVELNGDEVSYQHFFKRRRSLRLDQIRSVRGMVRSGKGGAHTYLVIEPVDPKAPPMKMRMDFFSHGDMQTIRNFFGEKLKRYAKRSKLRAQLYSDGSGLRRYTGPTSEMTAIMASRVRCAAPRRA